MADVIADYILEAAAAGDVGEVERLVGEDPGLLNGKDADGMTPLMAASLGGRVEAVRWLIDHGAAIDEQDHRESTALCQTCFADQAPVVRLLLERGADPTIADDRGWTHLIAASFKNRLEVVRVLLGHPIAKATINHRDDKGATALWVACFGGLRGVVRALLESGADPTIARGPGLTPMAIAKSRDSDPEGVTAEGLQDCVAALEVRCPPPNSFLLISWVRRGFFFLGLVGRMRSGPMSYGRPGRWRMRLRASRRRRWWNRGREARPSVGAWRQCRRS
jgi:hypothetical protein